MPRHKKFEDAASYTMRIPAGLKADIDLLARYNYASTNSEVLTAIRNHVEANRELLDQERERIAAEQSDQ